MTHKNDVHDKARLVPVAHCHDAFVAAQIRELLTEAEIESCILGEMHGDRAILGTGTTPSEGIDILVEDRDANRARELLSTFPPVAVEAAADKPQDDSPSGESS